MRISDFTNKYLRNCRVERENCPGTVYDYGRILAKIIDYSDDISVFDIDQFSVVALKEKLLNKGFSDSYRAKVLSVLKNFLFYLSDFEGLQVYDWTKIKIPKVSSKPVDYMVESEIDRFLEILPENFLRDLRFKTLTAVLADTGMRIGEAVGIPRESVNYAESEVTVRGKGGRYRKVYLGPRAMHYLEKYNSARKDSSKFLFGNINDAKKATGKWDPKDANRKFRHWSKIFGRRVNSHIFRKSFCTNSIHKGMPIAYVAKLVGHADNGRTTARYYYCPMSDEEAKKMYMKFTRKFTVDAISNICNEDLCHEKE